MTKLFLLAGAAIIAAAPALAQTPGGLGGGGIYMGPDGRVHSQVIVAPNGQALPVAPTFCENGLGPCPVILGRPLPPPPMVAPPPLLPYAPPMVEAPPPPPVGGPPGPAPLGSVYTRYTVCPAPRTCPVVFVSVDADGLNVRGPDGRPIMALVNGTPLQVLDRRGAWTLVAPACDFVPTGAWTWDGVPLSRCWVY